LRREDFAIVGESLHLNDVGLALGPLAMCDWRKYSPTPTAARTKAAPAQAKTRRKPIGTTAAVAALPESDKASSANARSEAD
jgi:hypothetical protein